jgi:hypothetical protein
MKTEAEIESGLGDLIVALTEETTRFVHKDKEVYKVVAYILLDFLHNSEPISKSWH